MSIKTDAEIIRDETTSGANTASRVGSNLVDIADDLIAKQTEIDANTAKNTYPSADASKLSGIEANATADQTGAEIKSLYEAEANTNAFTDALLSKINSITAIFTTALKTAYDVAESWVATNGASVLSHLSNSSNPHSVTKTQIGLGNVDNTSDSDKPVSTATQTALDSKQDTLVSATNIKTINGSSVLGSGDLTVSGGASEGTDLLSTGETAGKVLQADGDNTCSWVAISGGGDALTSNPLSQFAATTKAQLNGVISDGTPLYVGDAPTSHTHTASEVTDFETEVLSLIDTGLETSSTITSSRDAVLTDADGMNVSTASSDITITIPLQSSVAWVDGTVLTFQRQGSGNVIIAYEGGVTGDSTQTYAINEVIKIWRTASDTWKVLSPNIDIQSVISSNSDVAANTAKVGVTTELKPTDIDTLSELNAIITDATLIDTSDSRLSDARTPLSHTHTEADITDLKAYLLSSDIADFETTTELNTRDTNNRNRSNHTGTQLASTISDFDTGVSNNTDVVANTAKISYVAPTTETGVALDLSNAVGKYYNMASANAGTTYTFSGAVVGGWAISLINTTSEPTVTGATKIAGATWVTGTNMYLVARHNGTTTQFFFLEI